MSQATLGRVRQAKEHVFSLAMEVSSAKEEEERWKRFELLFSAIEELKRRQKRKRKGPAEKGPTEHDFAKMKEWLLENDFPAECFENFEFATNLKEGGGLTAKRDLKEEELVLKVPRKVMLHTLSAMEQENEAAGTSKTCETGLGTLLATDKLLSQLKSLALAVHLLIEKHNHASFWAPYIKTLPVTYGTCLYFTLDELKALQGSPTFHSAIQVITNVSKHYSYVFDLLENNSHIMHVANFTWEEFIWAMSAVMSRQNNIPLTPLNDKQPQALHQLSRQQEFALIPAWDMCNHDNGKITTFYDINSECTECYATRNFKKGEQIYIFYGPRGNSELLLHSGFVFDNNNYDSLSVRMRLPDTTNVCLKEKFTLLHLCGFKMDKSFSLYNNFVPGELLAFLRLSAMNEEEVKVALLALQKPQNNKEKEEDTKDQKEESTKFDPFRKYSERNEIAALAILANKCTQLLKAYPTSIEEDKKLLEGELSANMRSVVLLRLKEKELLHNIIRMASSGHMSTQPPPASASSSSTSSTAGSASSPSSPSSSSQNGAPSATASTGSKKKKRNRNRNKKKTDASASSSAPATNQQ